MKKKKRIKKSVLLIIELTLLILSVIFSILKLENQTIIFSILSSMLLIKVVKDMTGSYINIPFLFVGFHILYGLSGVISVAWGEGLSATYGIVFDICPYMLAYSLCTIGLLGGMFFYCQKNKKSNNLILLNSENNINIENNNYKYFLFIAICGFFLVTFCEFINFLRVGGLDILLEGKAVYQAAVDKLIFTIPTQLICQISLASLGVYVTLSHFAKNKISIRAMITCGVISLPYFFLLLFLGRRGPILAYLLIAILAISQFKPIKKLSWKLVIILLITYLSLGMLYGVRNYVNLIFTDFSQFTEKVFSKRNLMGSLNPGQNEFGCTFGNFNKLYVSDDYDFLYGKSYLQGLFNFVPSYLYPGDKPQMITYKFRDDYFAFKAEISSIASTAFSSILETYWNFWYFGAIIYVIYGYGLMWLDKKIKNKNTFLLLTYLSISPFVYSFHRSEFGHFIMEIILLSLCIIVIYYFYKFIYQKDIKISKLFHKIAEI